MSSEDVTRLIAAILASQAILVTLPSSKSPAAGAVALYFDVLAELRRREAGDAAEDNE